MSGNTKILEPIHLKVILLYNFKIEFINSGINNLMDKKEGQQVKVFFNVRGREWNEKYFVSLNGWRIELLADVFTEPEPEEIMNAPETGPYSDELPF